MSPAAAFLIYDPFGCGSLAACPQPEDCLPVSTDSTSALRFTCGAPPSDARFVAALAVSLTLHLTTLAVLGDAIGGPHHRAFSWPAAIDRPLEVVVAPPRIAAETEARGSIAFESAASAFSVATAKDSVPPPPTVAPRRPTATPLAQPEGVGRGLTPHVIVNDRVARPRFGEALDGDTLAQFPVEVDARDRPPRQARSPYPPRRSRGAARRRRPASGPSSTRKVQSKRRTSSRERRSSPRRSRRRSQRCSSSPRTTSARTSAIT